MDMWRSWDEDELEIAVSRIGSSNRCRGEIVNPNPELMSQPAKVNDPTLWHQRYGHVGVSLLSEIARKELVEDFQQ